MSSFRRSRRFLGPGSHRVFYVIGLAALVLWSLGDLLGLRVHGSGDGGGHADPVAPILLGILIILLVAKAAGDLFERFKQPAVLGELIGGVVLGNLGSYLGWDLMVFLREGATIPQIAHEVLAGAATWDEAARQALPALSFPDGGGGNGPQIVKLLSGPHGASTLLTAEAIDIFSRVGVIILLFMVGLESNLREMAGVGRSALLVALVGVVTPFALGYAASYLLATGDLLPAGMAAWKVHAFVGATLCATSVGITARVLKDLGKLALKEARIILGAAVIDDVMGLVILAVVLGVVSPTATISLLGVSWIVLKAVLFLVGALVLGVYLTPILTSAVAKMRVAGMKLIYALVFCFALSWVANWIELATIVGAFAAGLVLEEVHFKDFRGQQHELEELIDPIATFLVPVFFVLMGVQVKIEALTASSTVIWIGLALTLAAWVGKQTCGLVSGSGTDRLSVGLGMVPRGEVGLIFAAMGKQAGVFTDGLFSAMVIMVILTTLVTPPLLSWSLKRWEEKHPAENEQERPEGPAGTGDSAAESDPTASGTE